MFSALFAASVLIASTAEAKCGSFGEDWYNVRYTEIGNTAPIIFVEYRNNGTRQDGKRVTRSALLGDLTIYSRLVPHPRVFLLLGRRDCHKVVSLVRQIEHSGICKDSGCIYQFREQGAVRLRHRPSASTQRDHQH